MGLAVKPLWCYYWIFRLKDKRWSCEYSCLAPCPYEQLLDSQGVGFRCLQASSESRLLNTTKPVPLSVAFLRWPGFTFWPLSLRESYGYKAVESLVSLAYSFCFFFFPSGPYPVLKPSAHLSESSNRKNVGSSFYLVYCHFNPVFCHSFYLKGEFLKKCCCTWRPFFLQLRVHVNSHSGLCRGLPFLRVILSAIQGNCSLPGNTAILLCHMVPKRQLKYRFTSNWG